MSYRKNMRKSGNSWQKRAEFLTVLIPIKQYGFFFEIYSKMVWQESERMLLEEPRHEDLNKRSVCPASHAGSCHEWQGKLCSHPQCIRTPGNLREIFGANHYCPLQSQTGQSARGAQGGYKLVKAPEEYTTGEILRAVEGSLAPVACLEPGHTVCARAKKNVLP